MSDEQASSPCSAFCVESVATLDTVRKTPAARINLRAFPAVPQGKRDEMVNQTARRGYRIEHQDGRYWHLEGIPRPPITSNDVRF
jgi:predicted DCC family thiol-disulfide oxidoreductase YuxK